MSLKNYLNIKEEVIEIDNTIPSVLIHLIGGHCTGKSGIVGEIIKIYNNISYNQITALGKYSESKTNDGLLTGGMDGVKMTNIERYKLIKKEFLSNKKVIICEGMMIIYYSSFISRYYELQEIKNRDVYIILLETELEIIKKRLHVRSVGKEFTKERLTHINSKANSSKSTFERIIENNKYKKISFTTNNINEIKKVVDYIKEIIERYL